MKYTLTLFLPVLFLIGCTEPKNSSSETENFDLSQARKVIEEKNNRFTEAHITGDTAFLNNIFTNDAKVFPPGSPAVIGRKAIAALNKEYVEYGIYEFIEETTELYGCEDYMIDEGSYFMRYGPDSTAERGKYMNVWKRVNKDWKLYHNIWNTDGQTEQ